MKALLLDYDGRLPADLDWRLRFVMDKMGWRPRAIRYNRSRRGWHVAVLLPRHVAPAVIVAAQAILGSDWMREAWNLKRTYALRHVPPYWRRRWNVLYDAKL